MSVEGITRQINGMNQRGGRMLSMTDLIQAGTLSIELAAHLVTRQIRGVSVASCAGPGGTGKTTLLGALLAFTPPGRQLVTVTSDPGRNGEGKRAGRTGAPSGTIHLCHEISPGRYFSYLWGSRLGSYFALVDEPDNYLAFTIHADSPEAVCTQIRENTPDMSGDACMKLDLLVFMDMTRHSGIPVRRVTALYERQVEEGGLVQTYIFDPLHDAFQQKARLALHDPLFDEEKGRIAGVLHTLIARGVNRLEDVRKHFFLSWKW